MSREKGLVGVSRKSKHLRHEYGNLNYGVFNKGRINFKILAAKRSLWQV